jgi:hypothetical protein
MYQVYYNRGLGQLVFRASDGSDLALGRNFYIGFPPEGGRMLRFLRAATEAIPMEVRSGSQAIGEMPERIREFLFSETGTRDIRPSDYPAILRIGQKLMELSGSELEAYRARTVGTTSDLAIFEASVDRYIAEVRQRREAVQERERTKLRLYGLDEVYRQYRGYKSMLGTSATLGSFGQISPEALGTSLGMQPTLIRMREELTTNLRRYGFNSITEFEQSVREFETAFCNETVLIARDILDRYEHVLVEQEQRYQNTAETTALHQQLQPAREHFQEASRRRIEYEGRQAMMGMPRTARAQVSANLERYHSPYREAMARGRSATTALSSTHPLLGRQDFPHQALAMTAPVNVQTVIERYIRARRADAQQTRQNITQNPNMIWELDNLLQQAMAEQNIRRNSIYHLIIQDHVRDRSIERALINLAIAVFAIAAGLLSGGTGTVAVLGATTALGIGAYQAVEEFQRYERMSAAHGAELLSDDPSFAWVIVAIVGAGIDLAAAGAAIRALRPAIQAFNQTGDLVVLEQRLARLTQVEENIRRNVLRAAEAEAQARAAWRSVFRPPAALRMVIVPGAEEFGRLVYAVYLSARRGIIGFERFVLTREAVDLVGDVARLSPENLTRLKAAYTQAITEMQNIARHGQSLGMTENEVHAFLRMWNNRRGITAEQVMREMDTWRATTRIPGTSDAEHAIDELLRGEGRLVQPNVREGAEGAGRQGDRLIDGILTEYKTISGVRDLTSDGLSAAFASRVMDGRGQAAHIIVDVRNQDGMTREIAERGIRRAYGADNATGGRIQSIRCIGNGFNILEPRRIQ